MIIDSILYMEQIRSWKILSSIAMSSFEYTHDVLLHQPFMCNKNDRVSGLSMLYKVSKNNFILVLEIIVVNITSRNKSSYH